MEASSSASMAEALFTDKADDVRIFKVPHRFVDHSVAGGELFDLLPVLLPLLPQFFYLGVHKNHHADATPAQIGMKTEAAKFPVFCYNSLERGTLQSTEGGVVRNSPVAKAV